VGKINKEGFRAHEWELLDNVSFFSEIVKMVRRDRIKYNISGIYPPDIHRRHHLLQDFILSMYFHCTGLEPMKTRKASLLFISSRATLMTDQEV
jgi:hypothetical protein